MLSPCCPLPRIAAGVRLRPCIHGRVVARWACVCVCVCLLQHLRTRRPRMTSRSQSCRRCSRARSRHAAYLQDAATTCNINQHAACNMQHALRNRQHAPNSPNATVCQPGSSTLAVAKPHDRRLSRAFLFALNCAKPFGRTRACGSGRRRRACGRRCRSSESHRRSPTRCSRHHTAPPPLQPRSERNVRRALVRRRAGGR